MNTVPEHRQASVRMSPQDFRTLGHQVVDDLADFLATLPERPITTSPSLTEVRDALGTGSLPEAGAPANALLADTIPLLAENSLFNGHPRFWGYITSSATPIGAFGDLIASTMNPNLGLWDLAPVAAEIEAQTIRWIAELIDYPTSCGGVLGSGGNMANFIGFLAARRAKASWDVRTDGLRAGEQQLAAYVSSETHTWIQKAADLFGFGTNAIRSIPIDDEQRMRIDALDKAIVEDRRAGYTPFLVVGTAGTVSTGAVDPLLEIADVCEEQDLWFHVDGAYGAFAAALSEASDDLKGVSRADSIALDPHKWLYSPLEAGCTLVRNPQHMVQAFSFHPEYYRFDEGKDVGLNYYEFGLQNSRGFRALKVWLALRQAGRSGVTQMIRDDIALSRAMHDAVSARPELRAVTQNLSICTFRYVPTDLLERDPAHEEYLDTLNRALLQRIQASGEVWVSNAVVNGTFVLRACIVNFQTNLEDVRALPDVVVRLGALVDRALRPTWESTLAR